MSDLTKSFAFQTPSKYTFPSSVEVANGAGFLDRIPTDATSYATYDNTVDLTFFSGIATGTPIGGASIVGNRLDLTGLNKSVSYSGVSNLDMQDTGAVGLTYTPDFTGSPGTNRNLFSFADAGDANFFNYVTVFIDTSGNFRFQIRDKDSVVIVTHTAGSAGAVSGVPMKILFSMDLVTGSNFIAKDGVVSGTIDTTTNSNRDQAGLFLMVGAAVTSVNFSGGFVEDFIAYSNPKSAGDYVADTPLSETRYDTTDQFLEVTEVTGVEELKAFAATIVEPGSDRIGLVLKNDNVWRYWDGASWAVSDLTLAQTNTLLEIQANIASFTAVPISFKWGVVFHSDDGSTTPEITALSFTYDFATIVVDLDTVIVYGAYKNPDNTASGKILNAKLNMDASESINNNQVSDEAIYSTPLSNSRWEMVLANNDDIGPGSYYTFHWPNTTETKRVPKGQSVLEYNNLEDYTP